MIHTEFTAKYTTKIRLVLLAFLVIIADGCISPMVNLPNIYTGDPFAEYPIQLDMSKMKTTKFTSEYFNPFDEVWNSSMIVLSKISQLYKVSKKEGIAYFTMEGICGTKIDNDERQFYYETPLVLFIEGRSVEKCTVYLYPWKELSGKAYEEYQKTLKTKKDVKISNKNSEEIKTALESNTEFLANDILNKISTQLLAKKKWKWLFEEKARQ